MSNKTHAVVQGKFIVFVGTEEDCCNFDKGFNQGLRIINCPGSVYDEVADKPGDRPNCAIVDTEHECVLLFLNEKPAESLALRLNVLGMHNQRYEVLKVNIFWPIHFQLVRKDAQTEAEDRFKAARMGCEPDPIARRDVLHELVERYMLESPLPEVYFHSKDTTGKPRKHTLQDMRKMLAYDGDPFPC
jgi:hypothetical protein